MDCLHQCHELEQTVFREPPDHPCYRAWSCFFIIHCCNLLVSFGRGAEYWCCTFQSYGHTPTLSSLNDLEMELRYESNILHPSFCTPPMIFFFLLVRKKSWFKSWSNEARKTTNIKIYPFFIIKFLQLKKDQNVATKHGMHKPLTTIYYRHTFPLQAQEDIN